MAIALKSKPGLSSTTTLNIPATWNATWFRNLISNQLKGADVRNADGANGISISGTIASPYATISIGSGPIVIPSGNLTLTTGSLIIPAGDVVTQGLQVQGYVTTGFSGPGMELGQISGTAYLQAYNRTTLSYIPLVVSGSVVNLFPSNAGNGLQILPGGEATNNQTLQVTGSGAAGFVGAGAEVALSGGTAYFQGYNRTSSTFIPAIINGSTVTVEVSGVSTLAVSSTAVQSAVGYQTSSATYLMTSSVGWTNGAGTTSPTLGATGPTGATTPTKWIAINDNGTIRHIPAW
jgi:hypothetical protein